MSLDVYLKDPTATYDTESLYNANITHNLGKIASEVGIYKALWRPYQLKENYDVPEGEHDKEYEFEDNNPVFARDIIPDIEKGLKDLKERPEHYKQFDSPNGWGTYENFVPFVEEYLYFLKEYPDAKVICSR